MSKTAAVEVNRLKEEQQNIVLTAFYKQRDETADITLECKGGNIRAHKNILISGSEYFNAMFESDLKENQTNTLQYLHKPYKVMDVIIKFIYGQDIPDHVDNTDNFMYDLLLTSDEFQLPALHEYYWKMLTSPITFENFFHLWNLAILFTRPDSIKNIEIFVLENLKAIQKTDGIAHLNVSQVKSLLLFSKNVLPLQEIISFILTWGIKGEIEYKNRIEQVVDLIAMCEVSSLTDAYLMELLTKNFIVNRSVAIKNQLSVEAAIRWTGIIRPNFTIHAFEVSHGTFQRSDYSLRAKVWVQSPPRPLAPGSFYASFRRGKVYFFTLDNESRIFIRDLSAPLPANSRAPHVIIPHAIPDTESKGEAYFRQTPNSFAVFKFDLDRWDCVRFDISDYKCMLLVTQNEFCFDVVGDHIKLFDRNSRCWKVKQKLPGDWEGIKCICRDVNCKKRLYFVQKSDKMFSIYDIETDVWTTEPAPDLNFDIIETFIYCDEGLIFEKKSSDRYAVYNLMNKVKICEYKVPKSFIGSISFDVSIGT